MENVRFVTDEVGNKVRSTEYDAFGNWRAAIGQANIHMLFQGQQQDPESSLYYLRARYYDPVTGRFISRDPVEGRLTLPQTQNPYAYSLNNPINLSDPSGKAAWWLLDAAGTAVDAASFMNDVSNCDWGGAALSGAGVAIPFIPGTVVKGAVKALDKAIDAGKSFNVTFGHGARHLEGTGLSADTVEAAIKSDIMNNSPAKTGEFIKRTIEVGGSKIEYHQYGLDDGTQNVGTYIIPK